MEKTYLCHSRDITIDPQWDTQEELLSRLADKIELISAMVAPIAITHIHLSDADVQVQGILGLPERAGNLSNAIQAINTYVGPVGSYEMEELTVCLRMPLTVSSGSFESGLLDFDHENTPVEKINIPPAPKRQIQFPTDPNYSFDEDGQLVHAYNSYLTDYRADDGPLHWAGK